MWDQRFEEILRQYVPEAGAGDPIPPESELAMLGVDSMALLQLMLHLESAYDIRFPMDMLTEQVFRSSGSIWSAVAELTRQKQR
jgi:nodulation protein F